MRFSAITQGSLFSRRNLILSVVAISALSFSTQAAAPTFVRKVIDSTFFGECIALGDINGDAYSDVVVGGKEMVWYSNSSWKKTIIATPKNEFNADVQVFDVDGDGDLDIIGTDGGGLNNIFWLANPRKPGGVTWVRHTIGSQGLYKYESVYDLQFADLDSNGTTEVITRGSGYTHIWFDTSTANDPDAPWLDRNISSIIPKQDVGGLQMIDLTGDKRKDLVLNGYFLETPKANPLEGEYEMKFVMSGWPSRTTPGAGDVNNDGRNEAFFVDQAGTRGLTAYSTASNPPGTQWSESPCYPSVMNVRSLKIADVDGDNNGEVIFAEMQGFIKSRVGYVKKGATMVDWTYVAVDSCGSYNIQVADMGKNGDFDIVGCNIDKGPVYLWENQLKGPNPNVAVQRPVAVGAITAKTLGIGFSGGLVTVSASPNRSYQGTVMNLQGRSLRSFCGTGPGVFDYSRGILGKGTYLVVVRSGETAQRGKMIVTR